MVEKPLLPPLTVAVAAGAERKITPPPPPPPGPCRFPGNGVPGPWASQVVPPLPPLACTVNPDRFPLLANISMEPPAPPPPPPSFATSSALSPFAVTVPVPIIDPACRSTMPPPCAPLLNAPVPLPVPPVEGKYQVPSLESPAPPPPPKTSAPVVGIHAETPKPPTIPALCQPNPPLPPAPPFPPAPPPAF